MGVPMGTGTAVADPGSALNSATVNLMILILRPAYRL
jgi:hypothetical protein